MSQHMDALKYGNEIRIARGNLKRRVAAGEVTVEQVLSDPPLEVETMAVVDLLKAQYRWGRERSLGLLRSLSISEMREIGRLTERERGRLVERLHMTHRELQDERWAA